MEHFCRWNLSNYIRFYFVFGFYLNLIFFFFWWNLKFLDLYLMIWDMLIWSLISCCIDEWRNYIDGKWIWDFNLIFLIIFKFLYTFVFLWVRSIGLSHLTIYYVTRHLILYFLWPEPSTLDNDIKGSKYKAVHEIAKIFLKKKLFSIRMTLPYAIPRSRMLCSRPGQCIRQVTRPLKASKLTNRDIYLLVKILIRS